MDTHSFLFRHYGAYLYPHTNQRADVIIGVHRNLTQNGISLGEANLLLVHDTEAYTELLKTNLLCWNDLTPPRQAVLLDIALGLGIDWLFTHRQIPNAVADQDFETAATLLHELPSPPFSPAHIVTLSHMMEKNEWPIID